MSDAGVVSMQVRAPLTERILARLGGPRWAWALAWAVVFQAVLLSVDLGRPPSERYFPREGLLQFSVTWAYVVLLSLWGIRIVYRQVVGLEPLLDELVPQLVGGREHPFGGMGSTRVPIVLATLNAALFAGPEFVRSPGLPTAGLFVANLIGGIPPITFLWMYIVLLVGLNRLGRIDLSLRPFQVDRSLGLAPLGALAFRAFLLVAIVSVPLIFFGAPDLRPVVLNVAIMLLAAVLLFVSLWRLHRQVMTAKIGYLAEAHRVYAQAFEALDRPISVEGLTVRAPALNAAEALERRIAAIQEWPLNEGLIARLAAIVTGLTAAILARFILSRVGL